jgi:hypothetical protein
MYNGEYLDDPYGFTDEEISEMPDEDLTMDFLNSKYGDRFSRKESILNKKIDQLIEKGYNENQIVRMLLRQ